MTTRANQIERYYDTHPVEGEEVGQSETHFKLIVYLVVLMEWLFRSERVKVFGEMNFYQTENPLEKPITPDVAVVDVLGDNARPEELTFTSYYIGEDGPPPRVVFEIASKDTWKADLESKPALYEALGVNEYFAIDPSKQPVWTKEWRKRNRLTGWRRNPTNGQFVELEKDEQGRLWSEELQSYLVMEGRNLRLYDKTGQLRLTEAEFNQQINLAERTLRQQEQARAEADRKRAEKLAEFLRQQGFDPDKIE